MSRRVITKEARVAQIAQSAHRTEIDAAVRLAIKNLQTQIQSLYRLIGDAKRTGGAGAESGRAVTVGMTNRSGAPRENGEVVVRDPAHDRSFTVSSAAGDIAVVGVIATDSPDGVSPAVEDGAEGSICVVGVAGVLADASAGAISPGDYLVTHNVPGRARRAPSRDAPGVFAVALGGLSNGVGYVDAIVNTGCLALSETIDAGRDFDDSLFERAGCCETEYDVDGTATGFSGFATGENVWATPAMSALASRRTYHYDESGLLLSTIHSVYADGAGLTTVRRAFEYQQSRVSKIISELS